MGNKNEPAFPNFWHPEMGYDPRNTPCGLTKRELFAAMAMQGMLGSITCARWEEGVMLGVVESSVNYADFLIKELDKTNDY